MFSSPSSCRARHMMDVVLPVPCKKEFEGGLEGVSIRRTWGLPIDWSSHIQCTHTNHPDRKSNTSHPQKAPRTGGPASIMWGMFPSRATILSRSTASALPTTWGFVFGWLVGGALRGG